MNLIELNPINLIHNYLKCKWTKCSILKDNDCQTGKKQNSTICYL